MRNARPKPEVKRSPYLISRCDNREVKALNHRPEVNRQLMEANK